MASKLLTKQTDETNTARRVCACVRDGRFLGLWAEEKPAFGATQCHTRHLSVMEIPEQMGDACDRRPTQRTAPRRDRSGRPRHRFPRKHSTPVKYVKRCKHHTSHSFRITRSANTTQPQHRTKRHIISQQAMHTTLITIASTKTNATQQALLHRFDDIVAHYPATMPYQPVVE